MNTDHLSSRQLVQRALDGQDVPRPAGGPLAVHYCARLAGVTLRQYTTDARVLADSVLRYYERFRPDAVWLSADTWVTAEAMGARVGFTDENQPLSGFGPPLIQSARDIDRIAAPDPRSQGRLPLMVEALRRVRAALGDGVFVVACFDQYPFSLACALMGIQQLMVKLFDDRPMVMALMDRCLEYGLAYAEALAACDPNLLSGGDSPAGLLSPDLYSQVALPYERRLIAGLRSSRRLPRSLHICGDTTSILAHMASSGADVLELDHQVDLRRASRLVGQEIAIWGNLDPVRTLARGTENEVRRMTRQLVQTLCESEHPRYVVSSGCTLAWETPPENLDAMFEEIRA